MQSGKDAAIHYNSPMPIEPPDASSVRQGYDKWAGVYDHDLNPMPAIEEPVVQDLAGDVRGLNVLDLGCGTGRHALWLAKAGANVTAIDFSEGMLAEAARKPGAGSIRFQQHDLHEPLPFDDGTFDLIVSGLVLEHLRDLKTIFAEVHGVLKPAARFVVSTMHPAMFLRGSQARFTDPDSGQIISPGSYAHHLSDIIMAALEAGLRLHHITERAPDAAFAARYPRAEKYIDWPMVVVMRLIKA